MVSVVVNELAACDEVWADPAVFALDNDITEEEAEYLLRLATLAIWDATGQQFHGIQCLEEDYKLHPCQRYLRLASGPVDEVQATFKYDPCSDEETPFDVCDMRNGKICLPRDCSSGEWYALCNCTVPYVRVQYRTKSNVPFGTERFVASLAVEYLKFSLGKPCSLPNWATSVQRQGVSWNIQDIQVVMDQGLTGIAAIDQWVARITKRGIMRVTNPLESGVLVRSEVIGCGAGCGDGS